MALKATSLPFAEQNQFFRRKLNLPTNAWTDIYTREHDYAFVVAGANRDDLVQDFRQAVEKAIVDGTTLEDFRKDFDRIVAKYGWSYRGGRNWRSRVIYETNMQSSYMAGRLEQLMAVREERPYWQYLHSDAVEHPRPEHEALNGLILRWDNPWWKYFFPINAWGCQCSVRALSDLRMATSALKRFKLVLDRRGRDLTPGQPFRIRSLKRGIGEIVVRVGRYEDGTLVDGRINVTVLQDVFGLPMTSFVGVPPAGWAPPDREPRAITARRLFEVPYRELAGAIDPANLGLLGVTESYLAAVAQAPTSMSMSYTLTDRVGSSGSFVERGTGDWCPTGLLVSTLPLGPGPSVVTLSSHSRLEDVVVGMAALIDDEIVRVDAVNYTTATLTLARGCADTLPAQHAAGSRIWFYDGYEASDDTSYTQGVTVQAQLLTNTSSGQLSPGLAGTDSLTFVGRQGRPYPPGNLKANGQILGDSAISGELTLTWSWRDRLQQADQLIDHTIGSIGPEAGVTVSLNIYGENDTLIKSVSGLDVTSWNYPAATEAADAGLVSDASLADYYSAVLADAPYAFYKLIDGGATAVDSGASARNGSYNNGAAGNQKIYGVQAGTFDGVNDYVQLPNTGFADFVTNGISIFALLYPRSFSGSWQRIADFSNQSSTTVGNNNIIFSRYNNTNALHFGMWNGTSSGPYLQGGTLTLNKWQLVGVTVTPARVAKLWINGQVVATATLANMPANVARTANYIARTLFSADTQTNAAIAGAAVFDKGLSDARATAYWDAVKNQINQGRLNNKLRIEAWAVRDSIASAQKYNLTLTR